MSTWRRWRLLIWRATSLAGESSTLLAPWRSPNSTSDSNFGELSPSAFVIDVLGSSRGRRCSARFEGTVDQGASPFDESRRTRVRRIERTFLARSGLARDSGAIEVNESSDPRRDRHEEVHETPNRLGRAVIPAVALIDARKPREAASPLWRICKAPPARVCAKSCGEAVHLQRRSW